MKRNLLLSMLLMAGLSVSAQTNIFRYGFEDSEAITDPNAVAYPEYVNFGHDDQGKEIGNHWEISGDNFRSGEKSLYIQNDSAMAGFWIGALKFRNLPIQANTSYRVTYWAQATPGAKVRTEMQCGKDKSDVPFLAVGNVGFNDEYSSFNLDEGWTKRTAMFYYTNDDIQKEYYLTQSKEEPTLPAGYFLALSMFSEGEYYIDDISFDQSNIAGITYAVDALRVDAGYKLDYSAAKVGEPIVLEPSAAKVLINGEEAGIETVELHADGYIYIFLDSEIDADSNPTVKVTFTNPKGENGFKYDTSEARRPGSWDENTEPYVLDFSDEVAVHDPEGDYGFSYLYASPVLVSCDPENGSFDLPKDITNFTFTFNKDVNLQEVSAKLGTEELKLETTGEYATTLVFSRTSSTELPTATLHLVISNIQPEKYIDGLVEPGVVDLKLAFGIAENTGEDPVSTVFIDDFSGQSKAGCITAGWTVTENGTDLRNDPAASYGSGPRILEFSACTAFKYGMYIRTNGDNDSGYLSYGEVDTDTTRLQLEVGNHYYQLSFAYAHWNGSGTDPLRLQILDLEGNVYLEEDISYTEPSFKNSASTTISPLTAQYTFTAPASGNYVIKFINMGASWASDHIISNVKLIKVLDIPGAKEKAELAAALEIAKVSWASVCDIETGMLIDKYDDGATALDMKNALDAYTDFKGHAPSAYAAAVETLNNASAALDTHKQNVDNYYTYLQAAGDALVNWDATKYMSLSSYAVLQKTYNEYKDQILKDDATLVEVNSLLLKNTMELNNMAGWGIGLLTERLNHLTALATELGIDENDELIVKANDALTDDGALAWQLASKCEVQLYANFLAGVDYFSGEHEGERDSLNMTGYIRNPEMYIWTDSVYTGAASPEAKIGTLANFCPGWSDEGSANSYGNWTIHMANTGQGGADLIEKNNCPVVDPVLKTWSALADIHQEVTNLPVGKYRMFTRSSNQNPDTEADPLTVTCNQHLYAIVNGDSIGAAWNPTAGQWFGSGRKAYTSYIDFDVKSVNSTVKIGIYSNTSGKGTNTFLKALNLYMIDKDPTFDYATGVKADIATSKEVKAVNYYNINGMLMKEAQKGINIQKVIYEDGSVKINKILVK